MWDYPRPPRLELSARRIRVMTASAVIAETTRSYRVLETSHPPVHYVPAEDCAPGTLTSAPGSSVCEWKGRAVYWDVTTSSGTISAAGWSYPDPTRPFAALRDHVAFYPSLLACFVDDERVTPQPGDFYGGWVTADVVGPFKGSPGSMFW